MNIVSIIFIFIHTISLARIPSNQNRVQTMKRLRYNISDPPKTHISYKEV